MSLESDRGPSSSGGELGAKIYGEWFDELARKRAIRDGHGQDLYRALIWQRGKSYLVKGYAWQYDSGGWCLYTRMGNGNVRASSFSMSESDFVLQDRLC